MAEDDWMNADVNDLNSKFEDEDKPEEKKEVKAYSSFNKNRKNHQKSLSKPRRTKLIN